MGNNDAESSDGGCLNNLHESMHAQLVYSDFRSNFKKLGYFSLFLRFLEKISTFSKQHKNAKFRFLGVKSNFSKSLRKPPSEKALRFEVLLKPALSAASPQSRGSLEISIETD